MEEKNAIKSGLSVTGKMAAMCFADALMVILSMGGALWLRHDFSILRIDISHIQSIGRYMPVNIIVTLVIFYLMRCYHAIWRYAGIREVCRQELAILLSTLSQCVGMAVMGLHAPRSYPFLYLLMLTLLIGIDRLVTIVLPVKLAEMQGGDEGEKSGTRTMVVGAGQAGSMLLAEMKNSNYVNRVISCVVDDDLSKQGTFLHGVKVMGTSREIPELVKRFHIKEIIIAIPSATGDTRKELIEICESTGCKVLTIPGIYQIINGEVNVSMLREVEINDLLGRPPVQLKMDEIMDYVQDKVILVTGGGGSIGSEICRQLALHEPKLLIIFDIYENNAYEIQNELLRNCPRLNMKVLIGSVRNQKRVESIFETYHPDLVFHAAAHKHVPLMEDSPNEAIKNNVLGTWIVARAAHDYHAQKMVLISTDKAVRPTNVMGASKRICELIVQSFAQSSQTEFAAVRFGNVLGSNGSVVPLFKRQIAEGGPVCVTHPDIIRYFMTIPEAVNLVLQCGALARGGEIFILDMGEPVKILDLARRMIRLSGLEVGRDIQIKFTGLRPGEKLYEELLISLDNLKKTGIERIFVAQQTEVDEAEIQNAIQRMIQSAFDETDDIRQQIQNLVPEYMPKGQPERGQPVGV